MKRRGFIILLSGAALAWPLAAHAQQPERMRHVGALMPFPQNDPASQARVTAFAQALERLGWVEGKNIHVDYRFASGDPALYKTYAAELIGLKPDALLASPQPATAALRQLTRKIPIVAVYLADPVGQGFVQSLARPGGNITGFTSYEAPLIGKWLQLLKEIAPNITRVTVIFNQDTAFAPALDREIEGARSFGVTATLAPVHDDAEIEDAIAAEARAGRRPDHVAGQF
jgi:putative tryptophan/tyrosine transport system substrate-binding protein